MNILNFVIETCHPKKKLYIKQLLAHNDLSGGNTVVI